MKNIKLFTLGLSFMMAIFMASPALAQQTDAVKTGGTESEYVSDGENYRLKFEQAGTSLVVKVLDLNGNELADTKTLTGVMGVLYSDGTAEQFDLTSKGKNKAGITIPAGKTVTDVRMMVEVNGERNITGFNLATGNTHSGLKKHGSQ